MYSYWIMEEGMPIAKKPENYLDSRCVLVLKHRRQKYHWDCGIACILMVLPVTTRTKFLREFNRIITEEEIHESTWTIDLCYLLKRFNVDHTFCTITLGVRPGYKQQSFYRRIFHKEYDRVTQRFHEAQQRGMEVHKCSLSIEDFVNHLGEHGPIIVLIDANKLTCLVCNFHKKSTLNCLNWPSHSQYQGHYVVLCGFDTTREILYYRNPSFHDRVCEMDYESFEETRTSYGTDEDTILVFDPKIQRETHFPHLRSSSSYTSSQGTWATSTAIFNVEQ